MRAGWGVLMCMMLCTAPARAQETGGSTGASDFSDDDNDSSSSSSDWPSSDSSSSSGAGGGGPWLILVVLAPFFGIVFISFLKARRLRGQITPAGDSMSLVVLAIGLDAGARRAIQETMTKLALSGKASTRTGRAEMLYEAVLALQRARKSWAYANVAPPERLRHSEAESAFRRAAMKARARFTTEIVRGADGETRQTAAPAELRARPEEGAGFVVVTIVVVARRELAADLDAALADFASLSAERLVALELIWSPAADEDRMSSAELELHYPELAKLDATRPIGEMTCKFCSGKFPSELLKCPHCGAALS